MKIKITCRPRYNPWLKKYLNTKTFSKILALGILLNSIPINSFAGMLSEDNRYETFEGDNITINDILEEDEVDVEIEGNTLVNIFNPKDIIKVNGVEINKDKITVKNINGIDYIDMFNKNKSMIKPNTAYTVFVNVFENNIPENDINNEKQPNGLIISSRTDGYGEDVFYSDNPNTQYRNFKIEPGETGLFKTILHSKSDIESPEYFLRMFVCDKTFNRNTKVSFNVMIIEGNHIDKDIDYFEGMKSVGQDDENGHRIEISSRNKNLLPNSEGWLDGQIINDGMVSANEVYRLISVYTKEYIELKRGQYTFSYPDNYEVAYHVWDKNFNYVKDSYWITNNTFTLDKDCYIKVTARLKGSYTQNVEFAESMQTHPADIGTKLTIQLEEGVLSTNYAQKLSDTKEILLNEPLRGLPSGTKDKIVKIGYKWFVERNCGYSNVLLNKASIGGSDYSYTISFNHNGQSSKTSSSTKYGSLITNNNYGAYIACADYSINKDRNTLYFNFREVTNKPAYAENLEVFKEFIDNKTIEVIYELTSPIYEPINIDSVLNLYKGTTHVSTNSSIPANLKVTVDRTINRATEAIELAKANPTVANLSRARYWTNLLKESTKKDELQEEINNNVDIVDLQLERKTTSANLDLYIKCENMLSMSLDTNQISFDDFSGIEDVEKTNAVNITINSSLPYQLNAYLPAEIQNADKTKTMNKEILQLKESNESDYKEFANINEKVVLKDNCSSGNQLVHSIDIMLKGGVAHEKDVYKAVIKLEAEQK